MTDERGRKLPNHDTVEVKGTLDLWEFLTSRVIGQERPIRNIIQGFNIAGADLLPDWLPIASILELGPTGVGKTELALALADFLWMREKKIGINYPTAPIVKMDSGTFSGTLAHAISELLGAPAGYVGSKGHKEGARQPKFAQANFPPDRIVVVLYDEIEKALVDQYGQQSGIELLSILLAILDKAEVQTNWDTTPTSLRKTVQILTSNIGARDIAAAASKGTMGFGEFDQTGGPRTKKNSDTHMTDAQAEKLNDTIYEKTMEEVRRVLTPELLNRMSRTVVFRFLTRANFETILEKEIQIFSRKLEEKHNIGLKCTPAIKEWMLNFGVERQQGVRPLQRFLFREVGDPIATYLNGGLLKPGMRVSVTIPDASREDSDNKPIFTVED